MADDDTDKRISSGAKEPNLGGEYCVCLEGKFKKKLFGGGGLGAAKAVCNTRTDTNSRPSTQSHKGVVLSC